MWRLWQIWAMPEDFAPCAAPTHNIFLMPAPPRREAKKRCPMHPWIQVYFWRVGHDNVIDKCSETNQLQCETKKMTFMSFNLIQHLWIRITWCLVDVLNQLSNNQVEHWCFEHPLLDGTCPKDVLCYISLYYRGPNTNDRYRQVEQLAVVSDRRALIKRARRHLLLDDPLQEEDHPLKHDNRFKFLVWSRNWHIGPHSVKSRTVPRKVSIFCEKEDKSWL